MRGSNLYAWNRQININVRADGSSPQNYFLGVFFIFIIIFIFFYEIASLFAFLFLKAISHSHKSDNRLITKVKTITRAGSWHAQFWRLRLTTGSVGWNMLKRRLQIDVGRMWSCTPLLPGRIPRNAKNTARGEPMQKKFSTYNTKIILRMIIE